MTSSKVDLHEIARKMNVSVASVSRALNNKPGVSEKLRERILEVSNQLGYQPNFAAKALISGKKNIVGVSMPSHNIELKPFYELFYKDLTILLHAQGRLALTFNYEDTKTLLKKCGSVILLGKEKNDKRVRTIKRSRTPFVSVDSYASPYNVVTDDVSGIYDLALGLVERGYKKIAYLTSALPPYDKLGRVHGYQNAMKETGKEEIVYTTPLNFNSSLSAYRTLRKIADQEHLDIDALMCDTDEDAVGAIAALQDAGYKVPADVAVTGFDDLPIIADGLTTVKQDIELLASSTIEVLDLAISQQEPTSKTIPVDIVWREST